MCAEAHFIKCCKRTFRKQNIRRRENLEYKKQGGGEVWEDRASASRDERTSRNPIGTKGSSKLTLILFSRTLLPLVSTTVKTGQLVVKCSTLGGGF